jgi:hypothetical protein
MRGLQDAAPPKKGRKRLPELVKLPKLGQISGNDLTGYTIWLFAVVNEMLFMAHMKSQNTPKVPGPDSAGQSGADQGLPGEAEADSESVKELVQEGQFLEANVVDAIENAPEPDVAEVRTRQLREDDVPPEYLDQD